MSGKSSFSHGMRLDARRRSNLTGCKGKFQFSSEKETEDYLKRENLLETQKPYRCPICMQFHTTTKATEKDAVEVESVGRMFVMFEGLTLAKLKDPSLPTTFYVFAVPPDTQEDEGAVLEHGVLVAIKEYQDIWREKDLVKSQHHQIFLMMPTMKYATTLVQFREWIEIHRDNMSTLQQAKMLILNGNSLPKVLEMAREEEAAEAGIDVIKIAGQAHEMFEGRAVFRTPDTNRPYHREFHNCTMRCGKQVEVRAYISEDAEGKLKLANRWMPVDSRAALRPGTNIRSNQWVCPECMAAFASGKSIKELTAPPPAATTPAAAQEKHLHHHQDPRPQFDQSSLFGKLEKILTNPHVNDAVCRGASLMAIHLAKSSTLLGELTTP